jgi:hypothetical protein
MKTRLISNLPVSTIMSPFQPIYTPPKNLDTKPYSSIVRLKKANKSNIIFNLRKIIYNLTKHK